MKHYIQLISYLQNNSFEFSKTYIYKSMNFTTNEISFLTYVKQYKNKMHLKQFANTHLIQIKA